jgi:tRNA(Ile)-lysidine synthase
MPLLMKMFSRPFLTASVLVGMPIRKKLHAFEFRVWKKWRERLRDRTLLLACSGGRDSVALAHCLASFSERENLRIVLACIHHGEGQNRRFRDRSIRFVEKLSLDLSVPFVTNTPSRPTSTRHASENSMRELRHSTLNKMALENGCDFIALAHHCGDLMETRLMRLIRGTGGQGLMSMRDQDGALVRPFLDVPIADISAYTTALKLKWLEDPSNQKSLYFRNWLRHDWLTQLEKKRPGSMGALATSLETLANELVAIRPSGADAAVTSEISRNVFMSSRKPEQLKCLAQAAHTLGLRDLTQRHYAEVCKRVTSAVSQNRKHIEFQVGGVLWRVDQRVIAVLGPATK